MSTGETFTLIAEEALPPRGPSLGSPTVPPATRFWNYSVGMESTAMLWLCRDEIKACGGIVVLAHTGKQFPEFEESIAQVSEITGLHIHIARQDFTFDEFLFERGGMLRQGYTDCSRRMKRVVLKRFHEQYPQPWEINLGYNADEIDRAHDFCERNDKPGKVKWRFPLLEMGVTRAASVVICEQAGFTVLVEMYRKMGRFDCYMCPNQKIAQAQKVRLHYPEQWEDWKRIEAKKGYPILSVSAEAIERLDTPQDFLEALDARKHRCSCFGGNNDPLAEDELENNPVRGQGGEAKL